MGDTPLHLACSRCCQEAAAALIRHGADFNAVNDQGDTPLRKLLQHATRLSKDFHHNSRMSLARVLVALGFRLTPPPPPSPSPQQHHAKEEASSTDRTSRDERFQLPLRPENPSKETLAQPSSSLRLWKRRAWTLSATAQTKVASAITTSALMKQGWEPSSSLSSTLTATAQTKVAATTTTSALMKRGWEPSSSPQVDGEEQSSPRRGSSSSRRRPEGRDKVEEVFQSLMEERRRGTGSGSGSGGVSALQHLCRLEVRRHLPAVRFQDSVARLELSPQMRQYLMFLPQLRDDTV